MPSDVAMPRRFLRGETQALLHELESRMMAHAERLEFEQAAELRNQITARCRACCTSRRSTKTASARPTDVDILAVRCRAGRACVNLAMVRGGRHLGDRAYFPVHVEDGNGAGRCPEDGRLTTAAVPE
jgi:excinuclease ABC subunit C